MQTISRSTFPTVKTEGGLLPAELLQRVAEGKAPAMTPSDYHLVGERQNEAITRAWNRCLGAWRTFRELSATLPAHDTGTTLTRERWLLVLFQSLDFGRLPSLRGGIEVDGASYPISHLWGDTPIHLVSFRWELDRRSDGASAGKRSPHSLMQELLNRSPAHQWGIISNGLRLRLLRDSASLSRSAFVEFDLEMMLDGERYADFALLWLVCHQSRFEGIEGEKGREGDGVMGSGGDEDDTAQSLNPPISALQSCRLEQWAKLAVEQGTRAMDALRDGVQEAIEALGGGFLQHPANEQLRRTLQSGDLSTQAYYQQLRRLVYRLIFLFVAEDRNLLLLPDCDGATRQRYYEFYSLTQMRQLAEKSRGTAHPDLYRRLLMLFELLRTGYPALGLPGLGSYLFSAVATPALDGVELANRDLLNALRALIFTSENNVRRAVDYRNLDSEELGSIYESLLEMYPELQGSHFALKRSAGSERKTTGSHYTPTSLVNCLLDSALEPVVAERMRNAESRMRNRGSTAMQDSALRTPHSALEQAVLSIKVLDPACGSGHMLIGAARRLARHLARVRTGDEEPPPEALRAAQREVVRHCIYGVDLNETAVELCKVALWMETLEPGKPLSFLDSHIRCGNSLVGVFNLEDLEEGIPDDAFVALSGDDKASASRIKKRNSQERKQRNQLSLLASLDEGDLVSGFRALSSQPEETPEEVAQKAAMYETLRHEEAWRNEQMACNLWTAAFFANFSGKALADERIATTGDLRQFLANPQSLDEAKLAYAQERAQRHAFFHWCLEFPDVWARGGFDMLISNPPWERVKLQEKEWFAARSPQIASAANAAARKAMIEALKSDDPALYAAFAADVHAAESESHFIRNSARSPLCGRGDVNTYAVFAELASQLIRDVGRAGVIVPSGIATDDTTKFFFQEIMQEHTLVSLYDFENRLKIFPGIDSRIKFCLMTLRGETPSPALAQGAPQTRGGSRETNAAEFVFFALDVADLKDEERRFTLSAEEIGLLNPNTRTCPIFRSKRDAELTKAIYRRVPILIREGPPEENHLHLWLRQGLFHMTNDSKDEIIQPVDDYIFNDPIPLLEGKHIHQYDHHFAVWDLYQKNIVKVPSAHKTSVKICAAFVVDLGALNARVKEQSWEKRWFLVFRDIARPNDERSMIATIIPKVAPVYSLRIIFTEAMQNALGLVLANLNSFVYDFILRQILGGTHLSDYITKQCPVIFLNRCDESTLWVGSLRLQTWLLTRVLELTYTAWDLQPFAQDVLAELQQLDPTSPLVTCPLPLAPYQWNEDRRFLLRCELDAAYFHLYGIARDDVAYILDTFPIVKRKDIAKHGEYRTQRVILEIYDAMAESMRTGVAYETRLDPPPGDVKMCHRSTPPQPSPNEGGGRHG